METQIREEYPYTGGREGMKSRVLLLLLGLAAFPGLPRAWAWGPPDHAVLTAASRRTGASRYRRSALVPAAVPVPQSDGDTTGSIRADSKETRDGPSSFKTNDDDDDAQSAFGTKQYWDELYQGRGDFPADEYRWYYGWERYGHYVRQYVPDRDSVIMVPGIGNDPVLLDLFQNRYTQLTATDYSEHAIERQRDLLSYQRQFNLENVELLQMDARRMPRDWECRFDAILEKGALDAIYLSGDGNFELAVKEFERTLKPGGILISVSGVVPADLRRAIFKDWTWYRDGSDELQAGCFILARAQDK
jgi:SAM-dependent methyltransferase